jgi:hypothetical protein
MQPSTTGTLSSRDRQILEHVSRYRLTTIAALRRVLGADLSRKAASKIVGRLCDTGYLRAFTLIHPTRYYVLGTRAAKLLGISVQRSLPLGPQALPMEYAALAYAMLSKQSRKRLNPMEILAACPWLTDPMIRATHCFDESHGVLELLRVDLGGPADHVTRKCLADLNERRRLPEFLPFVRSGKFRLVLITATSEKASALRKALDRHDWPTELPIHFSIVSDLLSLTTRKDHA